LDFFLARGSIKPSIQFPELSVLVSLLTLRLFADLRNHLFVFQASFEGRLRAKSRFQSFYVFPKDSKRSQKNSFEPSVSFHPLYGFNIYYFVPIEF